MKGFFKHILKIRIVAVLRSFALFIFPPRVNNVGAGSRILIINLEALGDVVVFTGALKHYKKIYPDERIYLLLKKGIDLDDFLIPRMVDEVIKIDYRRFSIDPIYGYRLVRKLRHIGFSTVINHDFSAAEISGKILGKSVGASRTYVYEGMRFERSQPFDYQQKKNIQYFEKKIRPLYTDVIGAIAEPSSERLPHVLEHYRRMVEIHAPGQEFDMLPRLPLKTDQQQLALQKFGLEEGVYVVVNVNASVDYKRWPLERFEALIRGDERLSSGIVLIGSRPERCYVEKWVHENEDVKINNLVGKTTLSEYIYVISGAALLITNDTSAVHIAVATRTRSLCITGGGQFGMFCEYGDAELHKWVYSLTDCFADNWRCAQGSSGTAPCVDAISVEKVRSALSGLL